MNFSLVAKRLGITEYPTALDSISAEPSQLSVIEDAYLSRLEEKFGLFGEHFGDVTAAARAISQDGDLLQYCATAVAYLLSGIDEPTAAALPFPRGEGVAYDMLRLFPLLALIPRAEQSYAARGFSQEELRGLFRVFGICLSLSKSLLHRSGYAPIYFGWTLHYMYGGMFDCGSFNFQLLRFNRPFMLLRSRKSGELALVATEGKFHRSGVFLGTPGFTDERGAFLAELSVTDREYIGHLVNNAAVSAERTVLDKEEWECVLKPNDEVVTLHIPRGADISREGVERSVADGLRLLRERYPEYNARAVVCSSWLLDVGLRELLGTHSRIVSFGESFLRFPINSSYGRAASGFVFHGFTGEERDLPEDTGLRRKLKAHYLSGGHSYSYGGIYSLINQ